MRIYRIDRPSDEKALLERLGCDSVGVTIMSRKMRTHLFLIKGMPAGAANILKQDALAVGADLAVPAGVVVCRGETFDGVLMGTKRQLLELARREKIQPFGLKKLGAAIETFLKKHAAPVKIMGVINANDDSFYPASRFRESAAVAAIERMIEEGADIIDIGAVSSRPGSKPVEAREELARLKPVLDAVRTQHLTQRAAFSIDSYTPEAVSYALECGFAIVNDITGMRNRKIGELAKTYGVQLVLMHMQGTPQTMQKNPVYEDVMLDLDRFFEERIEAAEEIGLKKDALILDVGIGFGKKLAHNLKLLKNLEHFTRFGCPVLIGASRKSMIDSIVPTPVQERLPGTLAIHLEAVRRGASIVRCHDIAAHRQAIAVFEAIEKGETL
ncbi:dihydropteroate synthase [Hydrogenimonas urashimensis]|uniref:dihydropteroate synthase n=1 Tax=Hydrogenimonas urashimensis TaxID=2740515 RepID=UPI001916C4C1|nr:dihydropteroate synthase [Hydrogenimonas urashimensis]